MLTKDKLLRLFCILLTVVTFTSVFNDNNSLKSHKTVEVKVFLSFINFIACCNVDGSILIRILEVKTYGSVSETLVTSYGTSD
jgi:hypothetical protein